MSEVDYILEVHICIRKITKQSVKIYKSSYQMQKMRVGEQLTN